ncbi:Mitochondrial carrier protein,Mitochondrial carrier domain,Mitochondrial substrate/solute carrier [Cinara cedri]|uniref:Mitochondrial carrier protein,Mitochondrial carrier domain,Mitochondrial substrate/solute carrier n=1 Tax=Cinara cedri TaxID=506608 RepID=A0A5E4M791_9HEMI|nr:Mitochondrial carrier protein,Mitochondrial carrier domain,Mitochondrial substrate/solute carrier [Cinara cedri]
MTSNINNVENQNTWFFHSFSGACSGSITRFVSQPFDVIKIRFQLQVEPVSQISCNSKYKSIFQSICLINKEEGIKALWKGHIPGQLLSSTYGLTQFGVFQTSLKYLSITETELNQNSSVHFVCGVMSSTIATIASYPFDVIRTRLVAQKSNQIYKNMRQVAFSIYKTEGVLAYYRGLFPTLVQNSLQGGLIFMFYNSFTKFTSTNTRTHKTGSEDYLNTVKQLSSGFLSGIAAKTCIYPLDIVKKRLQLQDFVKTRNDFGKKFVCKGLVDCIYLTIKEESFFGLFKGLSPSLLKAGVSTALHLAIYEHIFKLLNSY